MDDIITQARAVILQYGEYVQEKDLNAIMRSLCEDAHFEILNRPLIEGKEAIYRFYEDNFALGSYRFEFTFTDSKNVSDVVFINGVMEKIETPQGQHSESIKFVFSFILKKEDGELKIWQCRVTRYSDDLTSPGTPA